MSWQKLHTPFKKEFNQFNDVKKRRRNLTRELILILISIFALTSCKQNSPGNKFSDSSKKQSIFTETAKSEFEILSKRDKNGFDYKIVASNFKPVSIQLEEFDVRRYFAYIVTTTEKCTCVEGQERNIRIKIKAFDNPSNTIIEINKNCDAIDLQNHFYKTVKYGCCGHVNHYEIYDYENRQIIEGDDKIVTGSIPNSDLEIYVGFTQETNDSTVLGTLYYTTYHPKKNPERFAIKIKSKPSNVRKCETYWPKISLQTNKAIDKFDGDENEYTLSSFDKIENENLINGLTIKFNIECTEKQNFKFLYIPIINGKPFRKNDRIQEMTLD